jgi:hypothetical protein
MNREPTTSPPRRHPWRWLLLGSLAFLLLAAGGAYQLLTLNGGAAALRRELMPDAGDSITRVQLSLDGPVLSLLRFGLSFANLPTDARDAIKSVRRVSVGVYENVSAAPRATVLQRADAAMARRGYTRLVGVADGEDTVLVYAPEDAGDDEIEVCVAACERGQIVIASVRLDAEPLAALVQRNLAKATAGKLEL